MTPAQKTILEALYSGEWAAREGFNASALRSLMRKCLVEQKPDGLRRADLFVLEATYSIRITDAGKDALRSVWKGAPDHA